MGPGALQTLCCCEAPRWPEQARPRRKRGGRTTARILPGGPRTKPDLALEETAPLRVYFQLPRAIQSSPPSYSNGTACPDSSGISHRERQFWKARCSSAIPIWALTSHSPEIICLPTCNVVTKLYSLPLRLGTVLGRHGGSQETSVPSRRHSQPLKDSLLSAPSAWLATAGSRKDVQNRLNLCSRQADYSPLKALVLLTFWGGSWSSRAL